MKFQAKILLAEYFQTSPSNLPTIVGAGVAGLSFQGGARNIAVVAIVDCPWSEHNKEHEIRFVLEDEDGTRPLGPAREGELLHIEARTRFRARGGTASGEGAATTVIAGVNLVLRLAPGRYVWRCEIDGATDTTWMTEFAVA